MDDVRVLTVEPADAGEILTLQRAAYATEAQLYGDPTLPALTQTYDELRAELGWRLALKATLGPRIVGAVRGHRDGALLHIGRLTVAPDLQGRGIGTLLLRAIERQAGDAVDRYALFTGHLSLANLRLYQRNGYAEVRREESKPGVVLIHLEKVAGT